ncbi:MAG: hypothetical protein KF688_11735 [Pirellulales bacterium]|nr:hypothetical protein [Pirellulales bacterium]
MRNDKTTTRSSRPSQTLGVVALLAACLALRTPAEGATLAQLFAGNTITAGNARFSHWELLELDSTTGVNPLLSQIFVTPISSDLDQPGLNYSTNGHLAALGVNAVDMQLRFRVSTLPGGKAFVGQSLALAGITMGGPSGLAFVSQENASLSGVDLGSTLIMADNETDFLQNADLETFAPQLALSVTMNVFLTGLSATDTVNLTSFFQLFSQTGPPNLLGDFDLDGDADGRDFLIWQRGGSPDPLSAGDLADWQAGYGGSLQVASVAVPEPPSAGLLLALIAWLSASPARKKTAFCAGGG